jgi:hypothetical protein
MNGIFYFSSTGNSLYIAEQIKAELGGEIRYIPKFAGEVNAYDKIIIVSPIHSFGLPTLVYDFFSNMNSTKPLYIVLNCGGMQANAPYYTYQLCKEKGLSIRSVQVVMMPEIYTLSFSQPKFLINMVLRKAPKRIKPVIAAIRDDKEIVVPKPKKDKWTPKRFRAITQCLFVTKVNKTFDIRRCLLERPEFRKRDTRRIAIQTKEPDSTE